MNELKDVFICHASEDKSEIIKPLATAFKREDISYWYDETEIEWGDRGSKKGQILQYNKGDTLLVT